VEGEGRQVEAEPDRATLPTSVATDEKKCSLRAVSPCETSTGGPRTVEGEGKQVEAEADRSTLSANVATDEKKILTKSCVPSRDVDRRGEDRGGQGQASRSGV
jgi:hypothetical protein